ncbi:MULTISPECIES: helix-turn-helix transcriptional regulator [Bacillota]|uniref:helix-turn-helix transcriptional regulator n=1 Tax=Bacillota TaxID=1239 RepID=UPI00067E7C58|nr:MULTISPECIES: helix-turn-helix transcriptional regulator [Bacillota]QGH04657.1 XRE family transcriptional regulator [Streptococcus dysgalactiae subsp. dysgalactiae]
MSLTMGEKIRILLRRKKITISDLANMVGTSRQNLTNKLNRDNFSEQELIEIATALSCKFEGFFMFDDGEKI